MALSVPFGPGTLTLGTTPVDFSCEVMGGHVTHAYEETSAARTPLCGTSKPPGRSRADGLSFNLENDLTDAGLYQYILDNDLAEVAFAYSPNTEHAASWTGTVQLILPADVGADEYGAPVISTVEWAGVGAFVFTAGTAPVAA